MMHMLIIVIYKEKESGIKLADEELFLQNLMDSGMSESDLLKLTNNLKKNPTFTSTRCQPNEPCYDTLLPTEQGWNIYSVIIVNVT